MNWIQENLKYLWLFGLAVLMLLTRTSHFGSSLNLPDASLAVFFLLGMIGGGIAGFSLLLIEAGLIDYVAITYANVSDYCVSPAYVLLAVAYGAMFMAGRWAVKYNTKTAYGMGSTLLWCLGATSIAFLVSNGSFYLLSGKFPDLSWLQYSERVVQYYPAYLGYSLMYTALILLAVQALRFGQTEQYTATS